MSTTVSPSAASASLKLVVPAAAQEALLDRFSVSPAGLSLVLEAALAVCDQTPLIRLVADGGQGRAYDLPVEPAWHPTLIQAFRPHVSPMGRIRASICTARLRLVGGGLRLELAPYPHGGRVVDLPGDFDLDWLRVPLAATVTAALCLHAPPAVAADYVVKKGDTLYGISRTQLGTPSAWRRLLQLNRATIRHPRDLQVGTTLRLPERVAATVPVVPRAPAAVGSPAVASDPVQTSAIVVKSGDTLFGLAKRYLHDGNKWRTLWAAVRGRVRSPAALPVGLVIPLPADAGVAQAPVAEETTPRLSMPLDRPATTTRSVRVGMDGTARRPQREMALRPHPEKGDPLAPRTAAAPAPGVTPPLTTVRRPVMPTRPGVLAHKPAAARLAVSVAARPTPPRQPASRAVRPTPPRQPASRAVRPSANKPASAARKAPATDEPTSPVSRAVPLSTPLSTPLTAPRTTPVAKANPVPPAPPVAKAPALTTAGPAVAKVQPETGMQPQPEAPPPVAPVGTSDDVWATREVQAVDFGYRPDPAAIERPFASHVGISYRPGGMNEGLASQQLSASTTVTGAFGAEASWRVADLVEVSGDYLYNAYPLNRGDIGTGSRSEQHGRVMASYIWPAMPNLEVGFGVGGQLGAFSGSGLAVENRQADMYDMGYQRLLAEAEAKVGYRPVSDLPLTLSASLSAIPFGQALQSATGLPAPMSGVGWRLGARYTVSGVAVELGYRGQRLGGTSYQHAFDLFQGQIGYYFR